MTSPDLIAVDHELTAREFGLSPIHALAFRMMDDTEDWMYKGEWMLYEDIDVSIDIHELEKEINALKI